MRHVLGAFISLIPLFAGCADAISPEAARADAGLPGPTAADEAVIGEQRARMRGCPRCHDDGSGSFAGGAHPVTGTATWGANLTPDPESGIGTWSDAAIARAIRKGVDDESAPLCPTMPQYADIDDTEMRTLVAWLRGLAPLNREVPASSCPPLKTAELDAPDAGAGDPEATADAGAAAPPDLSDTAMPDLGAPDRAMPDLASPDPGPACGVRINEVQTAGAGGPLDEFVELYNPCMHAIDLDGSALVYRASAGVSDVILTRFAGVTLAPGGFLVCANARYAGRADFFYGGFGLAFAGGGLALRDGHGMLGDRVGWGDAINEFVAGAAAPVPGAAQSISRLPDGDNSGDNKRDFKVGRPTSGRPNR